MERRAGQGCRQRGGGAGPSAGGGRAVRALQRPSGQARAPFQPVSSWKGVGEVQGCRPASLGQFCWGRPSGRLGRRGLTGRPGGPRGRHLHFFDPWQRSP